jgi:uncharacterized protein YcsI (UPF0317 family)
MDSDASPGAVRAAIRDGSWTAPTAGLASGYVQANLVVLPAADAFDFLRFCLRNPKPCPVLEVCEPGSPEPVDLARGADLRTRALVVSMRPMTPSQAMRAAEVTAAYAEVHGAPVHAGDPAALGIAALAAPDYGDPVELRDGEIPVFWACGVTPQAAAVASRPELMITHAPGHMFVTDRPERGGATSGRPRRRRRAARRRTPRIPPLPRTRR